MRSKIGVRLLAWSGGGGRDSRDHYPESRQRAVDGAALWPDRGRACADLRPDGRGELRPRRIPHDRHVRDVLSVRVLCARPIAVGAAGRAALFAFGAVVYLLVVRFAVRAKAN